LGIYNFLLSDISFYFFDLYSLRFFLVRFLQKLFVLPEKVSREDVMSLSLSLSLSLLLLALSGSLAPTAVMQRAALELSLL
jgi:hypothetical protein